jgi:hypothetical protein
MNNASVSIALKLDYDKIPVPEKVVIQLDPGEINLFKTIKFQQHDTDPLSAINLSIKHEACDRIQITMELAGRLVLKPGGEFKFGGTNLVLVCTPVIKENHFLLQDAFIKEVHFPLIPKFLRTLVRALVNKSFVPNLSKSLNFNLENVLDGIRNKINALDSVSVDVGVQKYFFQIMPNIGEVNHNLKVTPEAVYLNLDLAFTPQFTVEVR